MWKRWLLNFTLGITAIPVVIWLAFGPGIDGPYVIFTCPANRLLVYLNPSTGTFPSSDVLQETVLSAGIWFVAFVVADLLVVTGLRRVGRRLTSR